MFIVHCDGVKIMKSASVQFALSAILFTTRPSRSSTKRSVQDDWHVYIE